jgi:hypothetical protein
LNVTALEAIAADPSKADMLSIPRSDVLMAQSLKKGWRFYEALFAGFAGLIAVALRPPVAVRLLCLVLALSALFVALLMMRQQFHLYRQYREACQREGIEPNTMLDRPMPRWRKRLAKK